MEIVHHGDVLDVFSERRIKPTVEEASRGVIFILSRQYWCQTCRKKLYYRQEYFEVGNSDFQRVKKNIATWVARLKQARESDWVKSSMKVYPYNEIRVWV